LLRLQKIYKHPDDVDLFPGLLSETRLPGAVTGPTLSCLIGLQFSHIRQADKHMLSTQHGTFSRGDHDVSRSVRASISFIEGDHFSGISHPDIYVSGMVCLFLTY
jgi:hypothetical protein